MIWNAAVASLLCDDGLIGKGKIFTYQKTSYFTTDKVDAQFKMKAMCHNLLKAVNKVKFA